MSLRELVADASKVDEGVIEGIIADYVRYDPPASKIIFTPEGAALRNEAKLLVYLVAVVGWKYVVDEPPKVSTKPADIQVATGISGGTLRPLLKKLKDAHLIFLNDGHYAVQTANLNAVHRAIVGERSSPQSVRKTSTRKSKKSTDNDTAKKEGKVRKGASGELRSMLEAWITEGFFDEPRTIKDLFDLYHEHAVIVKQSSLSGLLLRAVRDGVLTRNKTDRDGKKVWSYRAK